MSGKNRKIKGNEGKILTFFWKRRRTGGCDCIPPWNCVWSCFSVTSLKDKMDKDKLDIILRSDFLSEFFPNSSKFNNGRPFDVYHYNGLARSDHPVSARIPFLVYFRAASTSLSPFTPNHETLSRNPPCSFVFQVRYSHGVAKILELDVDVEILENGVGSIDANGVDSDSSIVRCLRTKYPRVEIIWDEQKIPSIN